MAASGGVKVSGRDAATRLRWWRAAGRAAVSFAGCLAGHAAQHLGVALQAVERNGLVAVGAQAVASRLEALERVVHRAQLADLEVAAGEIDLAVGVARRGVVAVLQQHLARMLGARAALQLHGDLLLEGLAAQFQRSLQRRALSGGKCLTHPESSIDLGNMVAGTAPSRHDRRQDCSGGSRRLSAAKNRSDCSRSP